MLKSVRPLDATDLHVTPPFAFRIQGAGRPTTVSSGCWCILTSLGLVVGSISAYQLSCDTVSIHAQHIFRTLQHNLCAVLSARFKGPRGLLMSFVYKVWQSYKTRRVRIVWLIRCRIMTHLIVYFLFMFWKQTERPADLSVFREYCLYRNYKCSQLRTAFYHAVAILPGTTAGGAHRPLPSSQKPAPMPPNEKRTVLNLLWCLYLFWNFTVHWVAPYLKYRLVSLAYTLDMGPLSEF